MVFYTFHISVVSFTWGYYFFPTVLSEKHRLAVSTDPHDGAGSLRKPSKREPSRAEPSWAQLGENSLNLAVNPLSCRVDMAWPISAGSFRKCNRCQSGGGWTVYRECLWVYTPGGHPALYPGQARWSAVSMKTFDPCVCSLFSSSR